MLSKASAPSKTFRLVPTQYPPIQSFDDVASLEDLAMVIELEGWTNDRLVHHRLQRLPKEQWVYGINNASIIMASFLHAPINGLRFNDSKLGAWYCSGDIKTAIAEVASHLRREGINSSLQEMRGNYRSYTAKLNGAYVDLRNKQSQFPEIYQKDNWQNSQVFGEKQRAVGSDGIFYSSVRYNGGSNIVAYKPKQIKAVTIGNSFNILVPKEGKIIVRKLA